MGPYEPMGFTRATWNNPTFACRIKGPVNAEVTLDNTTSVTWGGWFKIAGLTLSDKQTQTTRTSLVIDPDEGKTPRYCGSGADLADSGLVREISW
jgi:hypothetical protein